MIKGPETYSLPKLTKKKWKIQIALYVLETSNSLKQTSHKEN